MASDLLVLGGFGVHSLDHKVYRASKFGNLRCSRFGDLKQLTLCEVD